MKIGDKVRIRIGSGYTQEGYKVAAKYGSTLVVDVTGNPYEIGWPGHVEPSAGLIGDHLYWYTDRYIKVNPKLFI